MQEIVFVVVWSCIYLIYLNGCCYYYYLKLKKIKKGGGKNAGEAGENRLIHRERGNKRSERNAIQGKKTNEIVFQED